jgi:YidC/Oxa1 family membrane protein insertase
MNNQRSMIRIALAYAVIWALSSFLLPKYFPQFFTPQNHGPSPAQIAQQIQEQRGIAARAEQVARTSDTRLSLSERSKKWDEAIHAYQQIERLAGKGDAWIDAKLQEARIHEERAATDAKDTGDYDQAQLIYKDLERQHAKEIATITVDGHPTKVVVGHYAHEKLDVDLLAKDQRLRHSILYAILDFFVRLTGRIPGFSYWFALVLMTGLVKAILFPVTKRQFKSMADMQRVAPKMKEIQEKLKGRPADEINRKIMALYKEEGVNPAAGCVPMVAQTALLWPMYYMIRTYEYQFRHGYFLWIGGALSHRYPEILATSLAVPDVPLLLLYLVSMFLTTRLQPPAADPQQAQQQKMMAYFMPVIIGVMTWRYAWPSAFTLYWLVQNVVSTWQQWHILKAVGAPVQPKPSQASAPPADGDRPPGRGGSSNGSGNGNGRGPRPVKPGDARRTGTRKSGRR